MLCYMRVIYILKFLQVLDLVGYVTVYLCGKNFKKCVYCVFYIFNHLTNYNYFY